MSPLHVVSLGKMHTKGSLEEARKHLPPGSYPINFVVQVTGAMNVLPDSEKAPTVTIPYKIVIGLLLSKMTSMMAREKAVAMFLESMREALAAQEPVREQILAAFPELLAYEQIVDELIAQLTKIPEKGKVLTDLTGQVLIDKPSPEQLAVFAR